MAKKAKQSAEKPVEKALVRVDPEKELKMAEDEWSAALERSNRDYDRDMDAAWRKYYAAMKADARDIKERIGRPQDYDKQYDLDMKTALKRSQTQMEIADTVLEDAKERYARKKANA